jgi:regulator of RNase E activity RraA
MTLWYEITMVNIDFDLLDKKLTSSVISDVLDGFGFRNQAMLDDIRPLDPGMKLVGHAATMLMMDQYEPSKNTFSLQMKTIDSLKKDEVLVVCSNESNRAALWGELLSTAARARGARGTIVDGPARDIKQIKEMEYPTFAKYIRPISSKGRIIAVDNGCPIVVGGITVNPGDIVFGDIDGIIIIPLEVAEKVISEALDVVERENKTREELRNGSSLVNVFKKYGTL